MAKKRTGGELCRPEWLKVTVRRGVPVVDSRQVAEMVGRPHWQLLRTIDTMIRHLVDNKIVVYEYFIPATYKGENGKEFPRYDCTRKGCDMVANKQTGERGTLFTAAYVSRFYEMDALLREKGTAAWQEVRQLAKETRKEETDEIKRFVEYARSMGSGNAGRYYTLLSNLANRAARVSDRDYAQGGQLYGLRLAERVITKALREGMEAGEDYHAIYGEARRRLIQLIGLIDQKEDVQDEKKGE